MWFKLKCSPTVSCVWTAASRQWHVLRRLCNIRRRSFARRSGSFGKALEFYIFFSRFLFSVDSIGVLPSVYACIPSPPWWTSSPGTGSFNIYFSISCFYQILCQSKKTTQCLVGAMELLVRLMLIFYTKLNNTCNLIHNMWFYSLIYCKELSLQNKNALVVPKHLSFQYRPHLNIAPPVQIMTAVTWWMELDALGQMAILIVL